MRTKKIPFSHRISFFLLLLLVPFFSKATNPGTSYAWSTGEVTRSITVTKGGDYYVTVYNPTALNISSGSVCRIVQGCGGRERTIDEGETYSDGVSVYPNPANNSLRISLQSPERFDVAIRLYDVNGQMVVERCDS